MSVIGSLCVYRISAYIVRQIQRKYAVTDDTQTDRQTREWSHKDSVLYSRVRKIWKSVLFVSEFSRIAIISRKIVSKKKKKKRTSKNRGVSRFFRWRFLDERMRSTHFSRNAFGFLRRPAADTTKYTYLSYWLQAFRDKNHRVQVCFGVPEFYRFSSEFWAIEWSWSDTDCVKCWREARPISNGLVAISQSIDFLFAF